MNNTESVGNLLATQIYHNCVDYCAANKIKDYYTNKPLLCYINRDKFIEFLEQHIYNETSKGNIQLEVNED